jgi:hypothetical protein
VESRSDPQLAESSREYQAGSCSLGIPQRRYGSLSKSPLYAAAINTADIPSLVVRATVNLVMQPGMVYEYPVWGAGLLLGGLAALAAVFLELAARQFLSFEFRRGHNDVAAVVFSVIGVTFAVLLAFVAMLAWEHFNRAKAASKAAFVLDVYNVSIGFADPEMSLIRDDIIGYIETVVRVEWPAQAEGRTVDRVRRTRRS